ncbi:Serine/threonine-protein kinase PknB [Bremerella volcania]|uniref:Serine/threonine-protein kinase PknB n=1 Tax=Bremerella volcania TaxID=2527984 RepID=A0A518CBY8_9BACT|nr:serine/threonine-protein kinase [Bremerella volcania]QDU76741.1 Serine/threonine-protein kinase PknB [Bremerella volcania]
MNETNAPHPTRNELESFFHGTLAEPDRQRIEDHVGKCDTCCDVLRTIPHDPLIERIHAATSSIDDGLTPVGSATPVFQEEDAGTIPAALLDHPRYRIIRQLGQGGMGIVYQAEHKLMERPVALKVISSRLMKNELAVERFHQEVKAAAKLSHRNIVAAYDAEQAGEMHFLVMEYIDGISLDQLVARRKPLPVLHACNYVMQAAQGLQHAFERGTVHRDIKPHNLMKTTRGTIKILDFGLARFATQSEQSPDDPGLTADFTALGTPDYMAPEQARDSKRADIRADLYSLGCTLYFLLAGHAPFPEGTAFEKVLGHCERQPRPLSEIRNDIPPEVIAIVEKLMAKSPDDRFQTPAEVVEQLKPFGHPDSAYASDASATQPSIPNSLLSVPKLEPKIDRPTQRSKSKPRPKASPFTQWVQRHRLLIGGGGAILGAIVALMVLGDFGKDDLPTGSNGGSVQSPEQQPIPMPAASQNWVNLISQVDLPANTVAGNWEVTSEGELHVNEGPGARMMLPFLPPREYDLEVQFTRNSGSQSIALHFLDGDGNASFDIDGWSENLGGIQNIDGENIRTNPTRVDNVILQNGRRYTAEVRVRRDQVQAFLDGQLLTTYRGDGSNLTLLELWTLPEKSLGLGAYDSDTTFHQVRLRPVSN